jgi:L-asparaginase
MSKPRIHFILLGGTISMGAQQNGGVIPSMTAQSLCSAIPGLSDIAICSTTTHSLLASANLTFEHGDALAKKLKYIADSRSSDGIVIVQGTDTLEEMAFLLDKLVDIDIPIIMTGAMRNPNQLGADGYANVMSSTICAAQSSLASMGVLVVMNDDIHAARLVSKLHTSNLAAFSSLDAGPVGRVSEGGVLLWSRVSKAPLPPNTQANVNKRVALVKASFSDDGQLLQCISDQYFDGLVIEALGAGHLPESYLASISKISKIMPVILASRVPGGSVYERTYGYSGGEIDLIQRGLIPSGFLGGEKSRVLLTLLLGLRMEKEEIKRQFSHYSYKI